MPAVTTDTSTANSPQSSPAVDALLELVEERAAILEYDGGCDRATAELLAREMVLGRDAAAAVPTGPALMAGADNAALVARSHPMVSAALERMPGRVTMLNGSQGDPFASSRRPGKRAPGHCTCGASQWVRVPIHGGKSARVDCGHCDRFGWFGVWYGKRLPPPWPDDDHDRMVPSPDDQPGTGHPAAAGRDTLSFAFLPTDYALPTGPVGAG